MEDEPTLAALLAEEAGTLLEPDAEPKPDDKPPGDAAGAKPPEGEEGGETPPDPLAKLEVNDLLKDTRLAPMLQQWAGQGVANAVKTGIEQATPAIEERIKNQYATDYWRNHFNGMSETEVAEEVASDKEAAAAWGALAQQDAQPAPSEEDFRREVTVTATRGLVQTYLQLMKGSGLPEAKLAELDPKNFTQYGDKAVSTWGSAIFEARLEAGIQKGIDDKWETEKETRSAEHDSARPPLSGGRKPTTAFDVMGNPDLNLEAALAKSDNERKGA